MAYQNISVELLQADIDAVKAAIDSINAKMPYLVDLSGAERKGLLKLGPRSQDFVLDANNAVMTFPNVLPPSFDRKEYEKDTALFKYLGELKLKVDSLQEKINNTYMAVGSEAMHASLEVYTYVQTARDRTPGLRSVADKLKERFRGQGRRGKVSEEEAEEETE